MWAGGNAVGRLRVSGGARDRARLRIAASRELDDGMAMSLPPAAVLVIRRVDDPLPGGFASRNAPAWRAALRRQLAAMRDRAVQPRSGRLPGDADVVLFRDSAELAACLALHCQAGGSLPWWCRFVHGRPVSRTSADAVHLALARDARQLPAVFAYLAEWRSAETVAAALDTTAARRLLQLVLRSQGLQGSPLERLLNPPSGTESGEAHEFGSATASSATARDDDGGQFDPAWPPEIGRSHSTLSREQGSLLAVALCLWRRPAAVTRAGFLTALAAWRSRGDAQAGAPTAPLPGVPDRQYEASGPIARPQAALPPAASVPPVPSSESTPPAYPRAARSETIASLADLSGTPHEAPRDEPAAASDAPVVRQSPAASDHRETAAVAPPWSCDVDGIPTRHGGVLYLVNVMRHFGLPERLEPQWRFPASLGAWGVLGLLGRGFLGRRFNADDALWAAIEELRGPAPTAADLSEARRWLKTALPGLKHRVRSATGRAPTVPISDLFVCPGRLYVTRTHVDFVADLDDVNLDARKAGLDRDPGWQPAFGRVIQFHFE